jgi:dTDP-4-amino-4,6-dideoxygalactose transaminase
MDKLASIAAVYGIRIIEDASHALGSHDVKCQPVGACQYSDLTVFSFHPVKPICCGEGGMVLTRDESLYERLGLLRSHGVSRDVNGFDDPEGRNYPFFYEQKCLGFNYRLSDLNAALGRSQLKQLPDFITKRAELRSTYIDELKGLSVIWQRQDTDSKYSNHLLVIRFDSKNVRDKVLSICQENGIGNNFHYIPIYRHPFWSDRSSHRERFPNMEYYFMTALSLPLHHHLTKADISDICSAIKEAL